MAIDLTKHADLTLVRNAASAVISTQYASAANLARRLGIGPGRAGEILTILEERGIVGPAGLGVSREVLVRSEQRRTVLDAEFPKPTSQGGGDR